MSTENLHCSPGEGGAGGSTFSDPWVPVLKISTAICLAANGSFIMLFRLFGQTLNASHQNKNHFLAEVAVLALTWSWRRYFQ
jgi:hypothetical protein